MVLKAIFLLLPLNNLITDSSKQIILSDNAIISLIICAPSSDEFITTFGHCALRVSDSAQKINKVYHYGVLEFSNRWLYLDFIKGDLNARISVVEYPLFKLQYAFTSRSIQELVLGLSKNQKQRLFDYLNWNSLLENRYYSYDYLKRNCATKIRDALAITLEQDICFDAFRSTTYRREITSYLEDNSWRSSIINFCFGMNADKELTTYDKLFLPSLLEEGLVASKVWNGVEWVDLLSENNNKDNQERRGKDSNMFKPFFSVVGILLLISSIYDYRGGIINTWINSVVFLITGMSGIALLVLWLLFDQSIVAYNFNLLWVLPTNLILICLLWEKKAKALYNFIAFLLSISLIINWSWLPQEIDFAFAPLILGLCSRYFVNYRIYSR